MASKTTRVTAVIAAKVEGDQDLVDLAKQLDKLPDQQDIAVAADVTGTKELDGLSKAVADLPSSADLTVAASVSGAGDVGSLATDLAAIPANTASKTTATVTGDQEVDALATDLAALPASVDTKADATVTGDDKVDALAADLKALPARADSKADATVTGADKLDKLVKQLAAIPDRKAVTVDARVGGGGSDGLKKLKKDLDDVEDSARKAGEGVGGFASESTGTLGSQFSGGIGTVADFGEQFRNLKGAFSEAGGGLKAFGGVFGGVAATVGAGLIFDQISGEIERANAMMEESTGIIEGVTQTLVDNGNQWDETAQKQLISAAIGTDAFQTLLGAGASVNDMLSAIVNGDALSMGKVWDQVARGPKAFDATTIAALGAADALVKTKETAGQVAGAVREFEAANGLMDPEPIKQGATAWGDYANSQDLAKSSAVTLAQANATAAAEADAAAAAAEAEHQAMLDLSVSTAQAALDTDGVSTALAGVSATSADAQRSLQFLGAEFDKLAGRDRTAEEAAADLSASILGLSEAAAGAAKDSELSSAALAHWDVAALNASKGGQAIYNSVNQTRTAYDESVAAAYEAAAATGDLAGAQEDAGKAADAARKQFVGQHDAMHLTEKQAEDLADQVGILASKDIPDKTFDVLADDKDAKKKLKAANAAKLKDKENKLKTDDKAAQKKLKAANDAKLKDKENKLHSDDKASPKVDTANRKDLRDKKNKLDSTDSASAKVATANAKRLQDKRNVLDSTDHATPKVDTYNRTGLSNKTAIVDADTQPAKDEIARLNGVQVDVELVPHLDPAALAAEARRNGVNVSTGSYVPPGAAPGQLSGAGSVSAAPRVRFGVSVPVAVTPAAITINVSGALDAASTARQIKQLLIRAERRTGPIRASGGTGLRAPV